MKYKFHLLLFVLSFLILTKFNIDPDLGWHLAYGNRLLESGEFIRADPFSWTMPGYLWANSYFAYQATVAFLFGQYGHIAAGLIFGLIAALAVIILLPSKLNLWQTIVAALAVLVAVGNLGIRPHTISFLLFAILLVLLGKKLFFHGPSVLFWFFYFAIWANFHRGFVVGLILLAIFLGIDSLKNRPQSYKNYLWVVLTLVAAILGTFVNPFGAAIFKSAVFLDLTSRENLIWIAEWQPVGEVFIINLLFAATGGFFIYIFFKKFAKIREPIWFLAAAAIFMFSFVAAGFLFYWSAIFIFLTTRNLDIRLDFRQISAKFPLYLSLSATMTAFLLNFLVKILEGADLNNQLANDGYPVSALSFLKKEGLGRGLFNSYEWGGYLDWQAPDIKVFIDGRMPSWRSLNQGSIFADYLSIYRGDCRRFNKYDIVVVLVKRNFDTSCFANWPQIYEDDLAKVLIKG